MLNFKNCGLLKTKNYLLKNRPSIIRRYASVISMNSTQGCMSANNASQTGNGEAVDSPVPTQPLIQNKSSCVGASTTSCTMCGSEMHHKACCISCVIHNR